MYRPEDIPFTCENELANDSDGMFDILSDYYDTQHEPLRDHNFEKFEALNNLLYGLKDAAFPEHHADDSTRNTAVDAFHFALVTSQLSGMRVDRLKIGEYLSTITGDGPKKMQEQFLTDTESFYLVNPATFDLVVGYMDVLAPDTSHYNLVFSFAALGYMVVELSQPNTQLAVQTKQLIKDIEAFERGETMP